MLSDMMDGKTFGGRNTKKPDNIYYFIEGDQFSAKMVLDKIDCNEDIDLLYAQEGDTIKNLTETLGQVVTDRDIVVFDTMSSWFSGEIQDGNSGMQVARGLAPVVALKKQTKHTQHLSLIHI